MKSCNVWQCCASRCCLDKESFRGHCESKSHLNQVKLDFFARKTPFFSCILRLPFAKYPIFIALNDSTVDKLVGGGANMKLELLYVHILYSQWWPEDLVWGSWDQVTIESNSIAQLPRPCLPSSLVLSRSARHKCFGTFFYFLFLAVYLSSRHLWNDLLMDDINSVIAVLYIYTRVPLCL